MRIPLLSRSTLEHLQDFDVTTDVEECYAARSSFGGYTCEDREPPLGVYSRMAIVLDAVHRGMLPDISEGDQYRHTPRASLAPLVHECYRSLNLLARMLALLSYGNPDHRSGRSLDVNLMAVCFVRHQTKLWRSRLFRIESCSREIHL